MKARVKWLGEESKVKSRYPKPDRTGNKCNGSN